MALFLRLQKQQGSPCSAWIMAIHQICTLVHLEATNMLGSPLFLPGCLTAEEAGASQVRLPGVLGQCKPLTC